jgi:lipid II isoglutaminyl synthase (glutamine-hydrolysing)
VGFENHSGQTFLGEGVASLAKTMAGFGNNAAADYEGARYKNVFGSYMHGSLLPKNPHFADYLIGLALRRKYQDPTLALPPLLDTEELEAHRYAVARYGQPSTSV